MKKRIPLIILLALLGYLFWISADFATLAAGVSIFLFGMMLLEMGFTAFAGGTMEKYLRNSTDTLPKSLLFGTVSTALTQSSSVISVITISFLSAGLLALQAGIGIIFGANLGTTTGAWLMAGFGIKIKLSTYALPMIVFGVVLNFQKSKALKGFGNILAGMGFLFLGIEYMKNGFAAFSDSFDLTQYAMEGIPGLLVYTLIGIVITVLMQSSHATVMLIIAALAAGQVTYINALAVAIGSNIGTTVTAVIGALGANVEGRRLAAAHFVFNVVTAVLALILINPFQWSVDVISNAVGIAADNWTLKLAVFHTVFNVVGLVVMVPAIGRLVRFLEEKVKPKEVEQIDGVVLEPLYLNESALELTDTAIEVLQKETMHLFENAFEIISHGLNLHRHDIRSEEDLDAVVARSAEVMDINVMDRYYNSVKSIYSAIVEFATRAPTSGQPTEDQMLELGNIRIVARYIAEIVKGISDMQNNVSRYMNDENEAIRTQYGEIRKYLAGLLRALFQLRGDEDPAHFKQAIEALKADLQQQLDRDIQTIEHLIRTGAITPEMATSLINDNTTAEEIAKRLIEGTERMFVVRGGIQGRHSRHVEARMLEPA